MITPRRPPENDNLLQYVNDAYKHRGEQYYGPASVQLLLGEKDRIINATTNRMVAVEKGVETRMKAMVETMLRETETSWRQREDYKRSCERRVASMVVWLRVESLLRQTLHGWATAVRHCRRGALLLAASLDRRRAWAGASLLCRTRWEAEMIPCLKKAMLQWCIAATGELLRKAREGKDALQHNARRASVQSEIHSKHLQEDIVRCRDFTMLLKVFLLWVCTFVARTREQSARHQLSKFNAKHDAQLHQLAFATQIKVERSHFCQVWLNWVCMGKIGRTMWKAEKIITDRFNADVVDEKARKIRAQQGRFRLIAVVSQRDRFVYLLRILTAWKRFQSIWARVATGTSTSLAMKALTFACWLLGIRERQEALVAANRSQVMVDRTARRGQQVLVSMLHVITDQFLHSSFTMWHREVTKIRLAAAHSRDDSRREQLLCMMDSSKGFNFLCTMVHAWSRIVKYEKHQRIHESNADRIARMEKGLVFAQTAMERRKVHALSLMLEAGKGCHFLPLWLHAWRTQTVTAKLEQKRIGELSQTRSKYLKTLSVYLEGDIQLLLLKCLETWRQATAETKQKLACRLTSSKAACCAMTKLFAADDLVLQDCVLAYWHKVVVMEVSKNHAHRAGKLHASVLAQENVALTAMSRQAECELLLVLVTWRQTTVASLCLMKERHQSDSNQASKDRKLQEFGMKFAISILTYQNTAIAWGVLRAWNDVVLRESHSRMQQLSKGRLMEGGHRVVKALEAQLASVILRSAIASWRDVLTWKQKDLADTTLQDEILSVKQRQKESTSRLLKVVEDSVMLPCIFSSVLNVFCAWRQILVSLRMQENEIYYQNSLREDRLNMQQDIQSLKLRHDDCIKKFLAILEASDLAIVIRDVLELWRLAVKEKKQHGEVAEMERVLLECSSDYNSVKQKLESVQAAKIKSLEMLARSKIPDVEEFQSFFFEAWKIDALQKSLADAREEHDFLRNKANVAQVNRKRASAIVPAFLSASLNFSNLKILQAWKYEVARAVKERKDDIMIKLETRRRTSHFLTSDKLKVALSDMHHVARVLVHWHFIVVMLKCDDGTFTSLQARAAITNVTLQIMNSFAAMNAELFVCCVFLAWSRGWLALRAASVAEQLIMYEEHIKGTAFGISENAASENPRRLTSKKSGRFHSCLLEDDLTWLTEVEKQIEIEQDPLEELEQARKRSVLYYSTNAIVEQIEKNVSRRLCSIGFEAWRQHMMQMMSKTRVIAHKRQYQLHRLTQQTMVLWKHEIHKIKFQRESERRRSAAHPAMMAHSPSPHVAVHDVQAMINDNLQAMMRNPQASPRFSQAVTPDGRALLASPRPAQMPSVEVIPSPVTPRAISFEDEVAEITESVDGTTATVTPVPSLIPPVPSFVPSMSVVARSPTPNFGEEELIRREQQLPGPPRANSPSRQTVTIAVPPSTSAKQEAKVFPAAKRQSLSSQSAQNRLLAAFPSAVVGEMDASGRIINAPASPSEPREMQLRRTIT